MTTLSREAEDALVALFAVKDGLVSEAAIEKLLQKRPAGDPKPLARLLVEKGKLPVESKGPLLAALNPEVIPGFRIEAEAGRGGMGVVYRARQLSLDRVVALKVLSRRLSSDQSFVEKFLAEARSAAKLNHENVVAAIDAGAAEGLHYFAMEFVDGVSVADVLDRDGPLPWERAFEIAEKVALALDHAHRVGIVHRDVKPENIMLTGEGQAKLCDLGLAKPAAVAGTGEKSDMTEGTPYYCSPEQALGMTDIDARSDVYSLGTSLYHMIVGDPPFDGDSARVILVKQVRKPFPDLEQAMPQVSPAHRSILQDMVVKERERRLESMRVFEQRLKAARQAGAAAPAAEGQRRQLALIGAVFGVFALASAGLTLALSGDPEADPEELAGPAEPGAEPTSDGPRRPGVTRVDGEDPPPPDTPDREDPVQPDGVDPLDLEAGAEAAAARRAADLLLQDARQFRARNPDDRQGARERYQDIVDRFGDTPAADQARADLQLLDRDLQEQAVQAFEALNEEVRGCLREGDYPGALARIDAWEEAWLERLPSTADQIQTLRGIVVQQAQARLDALVRDLATASGEARDLALADLRGLAERGPGEVAAAAREHLRGLEAQTAQREADEALREMVSALRARLAAGDLEGALRGFRAARRDERLRPLRDLVDQAQVDLDRVARAWRSFDGALEGLRADRSRLLLADGEELRGRLESYDGEAWRLTFKPTGSRDELDLDLRDLAVEQLLELALPASDGRANALYFVARRAPAAAAAALDAYVAQGGEDDPALRQRIVEVQALAREADAETLLDALLAWTPADERAPGEVVDAVLGLPDPLRGTAAYRDRFAGLQDVYRRARVAQLSTEEGQAALFRGELDLRRGVATLSYDFEDPAQLEDWRPDTDTLDQSRGVWQDDAALVRGKLSHIARFAGGALEVEMRAATSDNARPNLNVILGDRGGWTGALCGMGFIFGQLNDCRVDPSAPRKPGYRVALPCNVLLVLQGRPPQRDGTFLAAEEDPSIVGSAGRTLKIEASRSDEGEVRLRMRSRQAYRLPPVPGWDQPGGVAVAPLGTEIQLDEIEITGTLDPAWITERATQVANDEANALPGPTSGG